MTEFYDDAPEDLTPEEKAKQEALRQAWEDVLDTPAGRRVLWAILERCNVYGVSFTGDALVSAHNEGRRSIGLAILHDIHAAKPKAYMKMQAEALAENRHKLV